MKPEHFPGLYRAASALSELQQTKFFRALKGYVVCAGLATLISVINSPNPDLAYAQAILLLGALAGAVYIYMAKPDRHWYSARAVAESIKTITWRYVSRSEPFNRADDADRAEFKSKLKQIVTQNRDVAGQLPAEAGTLQITHEMERMRAASLSDRQARYQKERVSDQQEWYASKSALNRRQMNLFFWLLMFSTGLAVILAVGKVRFPTVSYWPTDLVVYIATALLSWIQARRFQELSASYALAAHEISLISDEVAKAMSEEAFSAFVADAESAFSREHTQWAARRDVP